MRRAVTQGWLWTVTFLRLGWRELPLVGLFLAFPVALVVVYAQAFGGTAGGFGERLTVLVVTEDGADPVGLVEALTLERFESAPALGVTVSSDLQASVEALRGSRVAMVIDARGLGQGPSRLPVMVDPLSAYGPYAESFARAAVSRLVARRAGLPEPKVEMRFTGGSGSARDFLYGVPGVVVFGLAFGVMTVALVLVREVRRQTLDRLALAAASVPGLVLGLWGMQLVLGAMQLSLTLVAGWMSGLPAPLRMGDVVVAGLAVNAVMAAVAVGGGVMTAAFSTTENMAANLSMAFIAPLAFLTGAMFPLPVSPVGALGELPLYPTDVLPSAPAARVLIDVLVRGQPLADGAPLLGLSLLEAVVLVVIAGVVFHRRRLRSRRSVT